MSVQFDNAEFQTFLRGVRIRALARRVKPRLFDSAMNGIKPLPEVLAKQAGQAEFSMSLHAYMDRVIPASRIRKGRVAYKTRRLLFNRIEAEFGVEAQVIAAIWGIETDFGRQRGTFSTLAALATLAWKGRRAAFFEDELIAALRIVGQEQGQTGGADLVGSWAGAMGHGQFMPSSYLSFAVDNDGDGRADIWGDDPSDALASVANYLARHGWQRGAPWGFRVYLPKGFDYGLTGIDQSLKLAEWLARGLTLTDGSKPADYGAASVLLPGGANGPAFLTFNNFKVLLSYNNATSYALAVALLAEQIAGARAANIPWPDEKPLARTKIAELQNILGAAGFDAGAADGLIGPDTMRAIRAAQKDARLPADGYPCRTLLEALQVPSG